MNELHVHNNRPFPNARSLTTHCVCTKLVAVAQGEQSRYRGMVESVESAILGLPGSVKVYIVDADGNTRFSTDPDVKLLNITDRAYFKMLKEGASDYVSSLLISRLNGEQIFVFSRRLGKNGTLTALSISHCLPRS